MIDWNTEWPLIQKAALDFNLDAHWLAAIRTTEAGGPGREFGVLSVNATTYDAQLRVCCESVRNRIIEWQNRIAIFGTASNGALALSSMFIKLFAQRWAPPKAGNDPANLNANWIRNATAAYNNYVAHGGPLGQE